MAKQTDFGQRVAGCLVLVGLLSVLAACGGGGGGGGGGVTYTGLATDAPLSPSNAGVIGVTAYTGGSGNDTLGLIGMVSEPNETAGAGEGLWALKTARAIQQALPTGALDPAGAAGVAAGATASMSTALPAGTCGGTGSISGSYNDATGVMNATVRFNAWCNEGVTISGSVTLVGQLDVTDPNNPVPVSFTLSFSSLTISDGSGSHTQSGTIVIDFTTTPETITISSDFRAADGKVYRVTNFTLTATTTASGEDIVVTGQFCHPDYGCVTISTTAPLSVATDDVYPTGGGIEVTGAAGSKARLTANPDGTTFTLDVDVDGDGIYESNTTGSWATP
ncbi:MAG: hypothetical protein ABIO65_12125 [Nitrospiria bacterium]